MRENIYLDIILPEHECIKLLVYKGYMLDISLSLHGSELKLMIIVIFYSRLQALMVGENVLSCDLSLIATLNMVGRSGYNLIITVFFTLKQLQTTCRISQAVKYAHTA